MVISYFQDSHILRYGDRFFNAKSSSFYDRFIANLKNDEKLNIYMREKEIRNDAQILRLMEISTEKICFHKMESFWNPANWFSVLKSIKKIVKESDFLYLRTEGIYGSIAALYATKYSKKYMSIMPADPEVGLKEHGIIGRIVALFHTPLVKKAVFNADYAYYVTEKYLQEKYPNNGVSIGCSDVQLESLDDVILEKRIKRIRNNEEKIIIGSAGALNIKIKGQDLVIAAISKLRKKYNIEYRIIGMGDKEKIEKIIQKYNVDNNVVIEGTIPHNEVFSWLDNIDIFIQPSRTEGLPRALIEAMSRALPCIGSNVGGIPELLDEHFIFDIHHQPVSKIVSILETLLDRKTQEEQARRNFNSAKKYQKAIVDEKNRNFFLEFDRYARDKK